MGAVDWIDGMALGHKYIHSIVACSVVVVYTFKYNVSSRFLVEPRRSSNTYDVHNEVLKAKMIWHKILTSFFRILQIV